VTRRRRASAVAVGVALIVGGVIAITSAGSREERDAADRPARTTALGDLRRPGSLVAADSLANTRIGGPFGTVLAFRFRAQWTGSVEAVRFYVIMNTRGRQGYSGGTGGRLRVAIARDSGAPRHAPQSRALASAVIRPSRSDLWPLVRFRDPPRVAAGRLYHVVFTNPARRPRRNYVSINALLSRGRDRPRPPTPAGMAVLLGGSSDGGATPTRWQPRAAEPGERYMPILDVVGSESGQHLGNGYMEVWVGSPQPVGGDFRVRQLIAIAPAQPARITGAWLRVLRQDGATAPLELRLERLDGTVLARGRAAARRISSRSPQWAHVRFTRAVTAPFEEQLALTASARDERAYQTFPLRKGTEFGFDPSTIFAGGHAEHFDGDRWTGWDQWGVSDRRDSDLQFALDVEP
jgi:hypothetical protein